MEELLKKMIAELFSEEMTEYLCANVGSLQKWQISDMIRGALIPLQKKRDWFYKLSEYENLECELYYAESEEEKKEIWENSYKYCAEQIEIAIEELEAVGKDGSIIVVHEMELTPEEGEQIVGTVPFSTYTNFKEYLQEYLEWEDDGNLEYKWLLIEKCKEDADRKFRERYSYVVYQGEIVFYRNEKDDDECWGNVNLNLPVYCRVGQIYRTDGRPFYYPKRFLITETGDNHDCCSILALQVDDGMIKIAPLKHGNMFYNRRSRVGLSPLYELSSFHERLPEKERALWIAKEFVNGCEAAGKILGNVSDVPVEHFSIEYIEANCKYSLDKNVNIPKKEDILQNN